MTCSLAYKKELVIDWSQSYIPHFNTTPQNTIYPDASTLSQTEKPVKLNMHPHLFQVVYYPEFTKQTLKLLNM